MTSAASVDVKFPLLSDRLGHDRPGQASYRVVHVIPSLEIGGAERLVANLAQCTQDAGHSLRVVCIEREGALADTVRETGALVHCLHHRGGVGWYGVRGLRRVLSSFRPDVVHSHYLTGLLLAAYSQIGTRRRFAMVHTQHGRLDLSKATRRWTERHASRFAKIFYCVSQEICDEARQQLSLGATQTRVKQNGIELARFANLPDKRKAKQEIGVPPDCAVVGTVGRLALVKNQQRLLRLFARVAAHSVRVRLVIVGAGPLREKLTRLAETLEIAERVLFVGAQLDVSSYLHAMDVFVLTSHSEGLPLAALEACAARVPIVTTPVGELTALLEHGRSGFICQTDDDFEKTLLRIVNQPKSFLELTQSAYQRVAEQHDIRIVAGQYLGDYIQLIASNDRGPLDEVSLRH